MGALIPLPGMEWPMCTRTDADGVPMEHRSPRHWGWRVAIHAGAALVTLGLWAALTVAFAFLSFGTSVCGSATAHQVRIYRLALLAYDALVVLVPLTIGTIVHHMRERSWPWFALGAAVGVFALIGTWHAQPGQWCF